MTDTIFKTVPLRKKSLLQILFRQQEESNAIIEVNNLLASGPILQIKKEQIEAISHKYKIDLYREFERNTDEFYAAYLKHCLDDKKLTDVEISELLHLKVLLSLDEAKVNLIHKNLAGAIYKTDLQNAISDGRLTEAEAAFLEKLQAELGLSEEAAGEISREVRTGFVQKTVDAIIAGDLLSPDEEKELNAICESLNVDLRIDQKTRAALDKMKQLWQIENLPLKAVEPDIKLQKNEICYYTSQARWKEIRGPSSWPEWQIIEQGTIYLTNKRIILVGISGNKNVPYSKIFSVSQLPEGVLVKKETGKNPILEIDDDTDIAFRILSRLLREYRVFAEQPRSI